MIQAGDYVYERGNEQSPRMYVDSVIDGKAMCSWTVKGERLEKEYEVKLLSRHHPKNGNPTPE
jgi:hypothetical protein